MLTLSEKFGVGGWTERPSIGYWAHLLCQLTSSMVFSFWQPLFWLQIAPLHCRHLWLNQIRNDGSSHPDTFLWSEMVFFHSHVFAVNFPPGFSWGRGSPPCVPLISSDLMDEDSRCPTDYQSRQMKAGTGRQLADVFYQTHFRWIHAASVCRHVRLNLSPFALNWSCLLLYWDWVHCHTCSMQSYTHIEQHTHTHTHMLSGCKNTFWPLPWVMAKNYLWCNEFWLITCCHRWEGSGLPPRVTALVHLIIWYFVTKLVAFPS